MTVEPDKSGTPSGGKPDTTDSDCMRWVAEFSADLRQMWEQAGKPSSRQMSRRAGYSHTALLGALSGTGGRLPSQNLTLALVRACRGDEQEWRERWQREHARITAHTEAAKVPKTTESPANTESPETNSRPKWHLRWKTAAIVAAPVIIVLIGVAVTQSTAVSQVSSLDHSTASGRTPPGTQSTTGPGNGGQNSPPRSTYLTPANAEVQNPTSLTQSNAGSHTSLSQLGAADTGLGAGTGGRSSAPPLPQSNIGGQISPSQLTPTNTEVQKPPSLTRPYTGGQTSPPEQAPANNEVQNPPATPAPEVQGPSSPLIPGDDSQFITDVTYPDNSSVRAKEQFNKTWEIRNAGSVVWQDRYLTRQTTQDAGRCSSLSQVPIPITQPGHSVQISVAFTAPDSPGSCRVDWKITNAKCALYFPNKSPMYLLVNVIP